MMEKLGLWPVGMMLILLTIFAYNMMTPHRIRAGLFIGAAASIGVLIVPGPRARLMRRLPR